MDWSLILAFIPTMLLISVTPGMCMTLAMVLGMTIGFRHTLWMMIGELLGVSLVSLAAVFGVATIMLQYPATFNILKYIGGAYIIYLGLQMWYSKGGLALDVESQLKRKRVNKALPWKLILQGFFTATANPKGWAFMLVILPPFINTQYALLPQISALLLVIVCVEFMCLCLYASGGQLLRQFLTTAANVRLLNRLSGTAMCGVGVWLILA